uniref:Uncharacterized protein n=1 Tax=Solanum lycopersicum TaxID=4081 RepID=A0A3Q7HXB0_SOLLC
MRGATPLGS